MYIIPYWYNQSSRRENERSGHLSGIDLISASSILITSNKWNHTPNIPTCNAGATKISICLHFRTAMASRQQLTSIEECKIKCICKSYALYDTHHRSQLWQTMREKIPPHFKEQSKSLWNETSSGKMVTFFAFLLNCY